MNTKMRPGTIRKYKAIQERFNYLYNVERKRYDDCIEQIMEEYFIEHRVTVSRIMTTDLPDVQVVDPNQISLFDSNQ